MADQTTPAGDAPRPVGGPGVPPDEGPKKPLTKNPWFWVGIAAAVLIVGGLGIWLFMSMGKVAVPDVTGKPVAEAKGIIEGAGLTVGEIKKAQETTAEPGTVTEQTPPAGEKVAKGSAVVLTVADGPDLIEVPDVLGKTKDEASKALTDAGLLTRAVSEASTAPAGQVFGQLPDAGAKVTTGSVVAIVISTGPAPKTAAVPNVSGKTQAAAESAIKSAGFVPVVVKDYSTTVTAGSVIGQLPGAGTKAIVGHEVAIIVSLGRTPQPNVSVPNVVGKSQSAAQSAITAAGLVPAAAKGYSDTVAAGNVISQSPSAGAQTVRGGQVAILISEGKAPVGGVAVPGVTGKSESDALSILSGAGLKGTVVKAENPTVPAGTVAAQLPTAGSQVLKGSEVTILVSTGKGGASTSAVPNVTGKSRTEAESALKAAGFVPLPLKEPSADVAAGTVGRQLPEAGKKAVAGSQVAILISMGKPEDLIEVPDVTGKTKAEAEAALTAAGFEPLVVELYNADQPAGSVFGQLPEIGTKLPSGATIAIGVSKGTSP